MYENNILVIYGIDIKNMAYKLCENVNLAARMSKNTDVALKPNYVVSRPASEGATTHPEVLEGIICYLKDNGINDITIMESAWVGDSTKRAFKVCGATRLKEQYNVKLLDLKDDEITDVRGIKVCKSAIESGFLINIPVLKGHCQTRMTCALKNIKGCIPDSEKRAFHAQGLFEPIGKLGSIIKPDITIVDGICGDLSFEEAGTPLRMDRLIAGFDSVMLDSYICSIMGLDTDDVPYIKIAESYGAGTSNITEDTVIELNTPKETSSLILNDDIRSLKKYIDEDKACSACYGSLVFALHKLRQNDLSKLPYKIKIGQGFIEKSAKGLGIGNCCSGCEKYVKGCPPRADKIIERLKELL
jgi:uncharacterized protein (DUF362 family)